MSGREKKSLDVPLSFRNEETIDDNDISNEDDGKDITVPSKEPSKRQLKREKAIRIAAQTKETNKLNIMQKALSYVSMVGSSNLLYIFLLIVSRL